MENSLFKTIKAAPKTPGVYLFYNQKKEVIYVGKAISLQARLKSYLDKNLDQKTGLLMDKASFVKYFQVFSEIEALILEADLIKKYQPLYNLRLKDDKSFLYIAITKEEFPKVLAVRKRDFLSPKHFFGPFPSAKTVRHVLAFLRKIYPFCQENSNRRPCFWSHLKLCDPCPGYIMQQSNPPIGGQAKQQLKKRYLSNIKNLVSILNGKSKNLVSVLNRKMGQAAKLENFEKAALYRNQIQKLKYVTDNPHSFSSFLESPNFFEEEREREIEDLEKVLSNNLTPTLSFQEREKKPSLSKRGQGEFFSSLHRIECYDISNLSGQFAVGSMVVFIDGVADKTQYRRFKINPDLRNDPSMVAEVLTRRLKHQEWPFPDLIVVDGGKLQVNACTSVLVQYDKKIPVIGLAKRLETIVVPKTSPQTLSFQEREKKPSLGKRGQGEFIEINLSPDSPALNLLKRLRDETHRFGVTYHRKLRKKSFFV